MRRVAAISAGPRSASPRGRRALSLFCLPFTGNSEGPPRSNRTGHKRQARRKPFAAKLIFPAAAVPFHQLLSIPLLAASILRRRRTVAQVWGEFMRFSLRGTLAAVALGAIVSAPACA